MEIELRMQQLEDHVEKDLKLLEEYENELRYETDPRKMAKYRNEVKRQRESLTDYQEEYEKLKKQVTVELPALMRSTGNLLHQMNTKMDDIQRRQMVMQDELVALRTALLARFDASEQAIISAVVQRLDESQLAAVQSIMEGIETHSVSQNEIQETFIAVEKVLFEMKQNKAGLLDPNLANEVKKVSEAATYTDIDLSHKLKIIIPIIPLILSYEGVIELKSVLNLKNIWQSLKDKVRGKV